MPQNEPLTVENSLDLLVVLLYAPDRRGKAGAPVTGDTRLQKLAFLLSKEKGPKSVVEAAKEFHHNPFKMGPFSTVLRDDVDLLVSLGMVRTTKVEYLISDDRDLEDDEDDDRLLGEQIGRVVDSTRYRLTRDGMDAGESLFNSMSRSEQEDLVKFKSYFNSLPLRQLLIFVYNEFPDYALKSTIRGSLGF